MLSLSPGLLSSGLHVDLAIVGCSDTDGEQAYNLDGEEVWYADFVNKRGVDPQPSFIDHISYVEGAYTQAEVNQQICRSSLKTGLEAIKDIPLENGKEKMLSPESLEKDGVELERVHQITFLGVTVDDTINWKAHIENVQTKVARSFIHSHLEYTPRSGEKISCVVEHASLSKPLVTDWETKTGQGKTIHSLGSSSGSEISDSSEIRRRAVEFYLDPFNSELKDFPDLQSGFFSGLPRVNAEANKKLEGQLTMKERYTDEYAEWKSSWDRWSLCGFLQILLACDL
uniref:MHC class II alpha chain N-terminal domain-containing protein n=1 Tax=Cynoglossus semilaevis TaxID=244447 RepID=A0A3P8WTG0_CYNSE